MKITLLCTDSRHPVNPYLERWIAEADPSLEVELVRSKKDISDGTFLFLISCSEIVTAQDRAKYAHTLVLHASDLPQGRGWSPHIWELSRGASSITLSLLEAEDRVDSGRIWAKKVIPVPEHALWDEINDLLFTTEMDLLTHAVTNLASIVPVEQDPEVEPEYYRRRTPDDSMIDANASIASQFNLIRVCDPNRFPAYFIYQGHRYIMKVEHADGE